jgi:hypothetical protein
LATVTFSFKALVVNYYSNQLSSIVTGELDMKKIVFPPRGLIIVGLTFFVLGLLVILRENPLFGFVSQIVPDAQSALIFGAVVQALGQVIIVFGAMKSNSANLMNNLQTERQLTLGTITRNMDQLQSRMQTERQTLMASYNQTMAKLDHLIATQKALTVNPHKSLPINCKFCGAKTEQGIFCPNCGKANY